MQRSLLAKFTKLLYLKSSCLFFLILGACIITPLALGASDDNEFTHITL